MYYILRFLQHACSVIKFVILTIVCRSKSASELMLHCYVYSTLNKSATSMSMSRSMSFYFILFRRFKVNRVTVFRTKRQRIVCGRIPGSIKL